MIMVGLFIVVLEARNAICQAHFPRNAALLQEFHGAEDRAEANSGIPAAGQSVQVFKAQMPGVLQKLVQDHEALPRML